MPINWVFKLYFSLLNENVNSLNYSIETVNKLVYIIGIARSEDERDLVINIAREVYGVEEVIDYISIKTDEFWFKWT